MDKKPPIVPLKAHGEIAEEVIATAAACGMTPNEFANRCMREVLAAISDQKNTKNTLGIVRLAQHLTGANLSSLDRLIFTAMYRIDRDVIDMHAKFKELLAEEWIKSPNLAPSAYQEAKRNAERRFDLWEREQRQKKKRTKSAQKKTVPDENDSAR